LRIPCPSRPKRRLGVYAMAERLLLGVRSATWHIVRVKQKQPLRYSRPPYSVAMLDGDLPVWTMPGDLWQRMERFFAPTAEECAETLRGLRAGLRWPRTLLAAFLGVSTDTLRRWETGERRPCGAARRVIWLAEVLVRYPEKLQDGADFLVWGQRAEIMEFLRSLEKGGVDGTPQPATDGA